MLKLCILADNKITSANQKTRYIQNKIIVEYPDIPYFSGLLLSIKEYNKWHEFPLLLSVKKSLTRHYNSTFQIQSLTCSYPNQLFFLTIPLMRKIPLMSASTAFIYQLIL